MEPSRSTDAAAEREAQFVRLCVLDVETTSKDPSAARITDIAAIIFDSDRDTVLTSFGGLCRLPTGVTVPEEVVELTGITTDDCRDWGKPLSDALLEVGSVCDRAGVSYLVGHKIRSYDLPVIAAESSRLLLEVGDSLKSFLALPLIDTTEDLPLPPRTTSLRLTHLAADHGFLVDGAHRAMADAVATLRLLRCYPLDEVVRRSGAPRIRLMAWGLPYDRREEAKTLRFHWDPARKVWFKEIREYELDSVVATFPITIEEVK
jgi:DNA polymerase-3 subunit epsilon